MGNAYNMQYDWLWLHIYGKGNTYAVDYFCFWFLYWVYDDEMFPIDRFQTFTRSRSEICNAKHDQ